MNEVLIGDYIYDQYQPELIQMVLNKLVPECLRFETYLFHKRLILNDSQKITVFILTMACHCCLVLMRRNVVIYISIYRLTRQCIYRLISILFID